MQSRSTITFLTIRTEGALLPPDLLRRIQEGDKSLPGLTPDAYHLPAGTKLNEATSNAWNTLLGSWAAFKTGRAALPKDDPGTTLTREKWLLQLFQELNYGRLQTSKALELEGKSYPISHAWGSCPIHLVGCNVDLDKRTAGVAGAARNSPHSLVQELLNRSGDHLWGFVSNGLTLRILRDSASITRQAFVEFDLEAMMDGEVYADFVLLWMLLHQSRIEGDKPETCFLEQWSKKASEDGTRALEFLRDGVEQAISALGSGFLSHKANKELHSSLKQGQLTTQDYYRQLLRLVYRLLFIFVAEDRNLLFIPDASEEAKKRYHHYSTKLLRERAEGRRTRHSDLYEGLKLVMKILGDNGEPALGLPALGSFLFSDKATESLNTCQLSNQDLLKAIHALAFTTLQGTRRAVDYKNLGSEELGSVYESLLELYPDVNVDAGTFQLNEVAGNERKTTGSYYTPSSLINLLLDSALNPVLDNAIRGKSRDDAEKAILNLKVVDPACGSGHFLIGAARRIARQLATIRTGDDEPTPKDTRHALRDVIQNCIYGVDINEMAVELCKVALWMEAIEPGKPLNFLDHRIRRGNSILGAPSTFYTLGIPVTAYKRDNVPKDVQGVLKTLTPSKVTEWRSQDHLIQPSISLPSLPFTEETLAEVHQKMNAYHKWRQEDNVKKWTLFADYWLSPWFIEPEFNKPSPDMNGLSVIAQHIEQTPFEVLVSLPDVSPVYEQLKKVSENNKFFHWWLEFPEVFFHRDGLPNLAGGFDVILGNPPWEKFTISDEEWFASREPAIGRIKGKAQRDKLIKQLKTTASNLFEAYREAQNDVQKLTRVLTRDSGLYPITGFKELNTYHLFTELAERLVQSQGRVGLIVKTGIGSAENCLPLFRKLTDGKQLVSLFDFVNKKPLFPSVQTVERFSLITFTGNAGHEKPMQFATLCTEPSDLNKQDRQYSLTTEDISLMSPTNSACPLLKSNTCVNIMRRIYRTFPVLNNTDSEKPSSYWNVEYVRIFDMATDSGEFKRLEEFEDEGFHPDTKRIVRTQQDEYLPLYEGKYIYLFDHRYGSFETVPVSKKYGRKAEAPSPTSEQFMNPEYEILPRYWFPKILWENRVKQRNLRSDFHFLFRDVGGVYPDLRTAISAVCPASPAGDKAPTLTIPTTGDRASDVRKLLALVGLFNSIPFDYIVRNKLFSKSLKFNTLGQIPLPPPGQVVINDEESNKYEAALLRSSLALTYTTWSLKPLGDALGVAQPFLFSVAKRFQLMRQIDALSAYFYGLSRDEFTYILSTFETLRNSEVKEYGEYKTATDALRYFELIEQGCELPRIEIQI